MRNSTASMLREHASFFVFPFAELQFIVQSVDTSALSLLIISELTLPRSSSSCSSVSQLSALTSADLTSRSPVARHAFLSFMAFVPRSDRQTDTSITGSDNVSWADKPVSVASTTVCDAAKSFERRSGEASLREYHAFPING